VGPTSAMQGRKKEGKVLQRKKHPALLLRGPLIIKDEGMPHERLRVRTCGARGQERERLSTTTTEGGGHLTDLACQQRRALLRHLSERESRGDHASSLRGRLGGAPGGRKREIGGSPCQLMFVQGGKHFFTLSYGKKEVGSGGGPGTPSP